MPHFRKGSESVGSNAQVLKEVITKYTLKITDLEDKCFKLQGELDGRKTELLVILISVMLIIYQNTNSLYTYLRFFYFIESRIKVKWSGGKT